MNHEVEDFLQSKPKYNNDNNSRISDKNSYDQEL